MCEDLLKSSFIKQKRNQFSAALNLFLGNIQVPRSFSETWKSHIRDPLRTDPSNDLTEPVKVKISGYAAKMSRNTNFMTLSFCLLQTGEKVMYSRGNRTTAVVNGPEKYDTLKHSFSSTIIEINTFLETCFIEVDGKEVQIEMFLGGDYKFLFMVMGLNAATSTHACLCC